MIILMCKFRGKRSALWTLTCRFRGKRSTLWTLKCRLRVKCGFRGMRSYVGSHVCSFVCAPMCVFSCACVLSRLSCAFTCPSVCVLSGPPACPQISRHLSPPLGRWPLELRGFGFGAYLGGSRLGRIWEQLKHQSQPRTSGLQLLLQKLLTPTSHRWNKYESHTRAIFQMDPA